MGPETCPVLGLGSGGKLLRHFQTPVLYWKNFSLRDDGDGDDDDDLHTNSVLTKLGFH